jgi:hypothetical protein
VGSSLVVVRDVFADYSFEVAGAPDEDVVQALGADGQHPAFRASVRVRCTDWRLDDLGVFGLEDGVEG